MTDSIPKNVASDSKCGAYQNLADSDTHSEVVVPNEAYFEDPSTKDILYGMDITFVYDTVPGMDVKNAEPNLTYVQHTDPSKIDFIHAMPDQAASSHVGSENVESGNFDFEKCGYNSNESNSSEFHDAEEFHDNFQELRSTLSAKVSNDDQPNQGAQEERIMLKRWLNEPVKDGPYVAS